MRKLIGVLVCVAICVYGQSAQAQALPPPDSAVMIAAMDAWNAGVAARVKRDAADAASTSAKSIDYNAIFARICANPGAYTANQLIRSLDLATNIIPYELSSGDSDYASGLTFGNNGTAYWDAGYNRMMTGDYTGAVMRFITAYSLFNQAADKFESSRLHYVEASARIAELSVLAGPP